MQDINNFELQIKKIEDRAYAALADMETAKKKLKNCLEEFDQHRELANKGIYRIELGDLISFQLQDGGEIWQDNVAEISMMGRVVKVSSGRLVGFPQITEVHKFKLTVVKGGAA